MCVGHVGCAPSELVIPGSEDVGHKIHPPTFYHLLPGGISCIPTVNKSRERQRVWGLLQGGRDLGWGVGSWFGLLRHHSRRFRPRGNRASSTSALDVTGNLLGALRH